MFEKNFQVQMYQGTGEPKKKKKISKFKVKYTSN